MIEYPKIQTLWKRQSEKPCDMVLGQFALPEFRFLRDARWDWTEKIDGTNVRIGWDGHKVTFGGRTDRAQMPVSLVGHLNELFGGETNEQLFEQTFDYDDPQVTLFGEGFGAKIQKGGGNYNPDGVEFALFDVKVGDWWLERENVIGVAESLGVQHVPTVGFGTLDTFSDHVAHGISSAWGDAAAEGAVAHPIVELQNRRGHRIQTKLKTADFRKLEER